MLNLYTETTIEVKPATPASRLEFHIPRKNGPYNKSKSSGLSHKGDNLTKDEPASSEQYLASSSSVYFRQTKHYPRTFLWRVLAGQRTLEVQSADLSRPEKDQKEAYLTLSYEFQDPILPLGVSFADPTNTDELHIFVCTERNEVFNLRLATDFFRSNAAIPQDIGEWCRPVDVSSLTLDKVYTIHASTPFEIFLAFTNGRIQALRRKADSETWSPDFYDDMSWGASLRGLVTRRGPQYIDHKSGRLALTTPQAMVTSTDANYLYTLCLNHTLRVWHLASGRLVDARDLLDVARGPHERIQLHPSEPGLLQLVRFPTDNHQTLVTYTPHEGGQFKFWKIRGGLTSPLTVEDKFPNTKLTPPDPDPSGNTLWSLSAFELVAGTELGSSQLWTLWRSNNYHRLYTMHFDINTVSEAWEVNWVAASSTSNRPRAPDLVLVDPEDVTQKWLDFLFFPGRYSAAIIETALLKYQEITGTKLQSSSRSKNVKERLCAIVASSVSLRKYDDSEMDFDRFNIDTDHQWRNFWRILEAMVDERHAPLSLAYDTFSGMTWIVMTDACAAVRECSRAELLQYNDAESISNSGEIIAARWPHRRAVDDQILFETIAQTLRAAQRFRKSFTPELAYEFSCAVEEELFTESELTTPERIILIFNQVGFSEGLSEGAEQQLIKELETMGGLDGLSNDLIYSVLELLSTISSKKPKTSLRNTLFGSTILNTALLDDILLTREVLLNILVLVIFVDESSIFDPPELFEQIIVALREQERNLWLSTHHRLLPVEFVGASGRTDPCDQAELTVHNGRPTSVMEDIFMRSVRPQAAVDRPMMYLLTDMVAETQKWATGREAVTHEDAVVHIQCYLIAHNDIELALEFLKFQPSTPWSMYVKGRLQLVRGSMSEAALYFRKAAYPLGCGKAIGDLKEMSSGLLSLLDAEHFNSGLPRYYQHVMNLFEGQKAFSQTAEFGRLSLQALTRDQRDPVPRFQAEVLSRLFTAELKRNKFDAAYETLVQFPDSALQKSAATSLVAAILDPAISAMNASDALRLLQNLPWPLYPQLAAHLDRYLADLSKKQSAVPGFGAQWTTSSTVDYLGILHALRLSRNDFRGAVGVLFDRLRIVQRSGRARGDPQATSLRHALLALINAMTCVAADEAYILADTEDDPRVQGVKRNRSQQDLSENKSRKRKRVIITLEDLRREYQQVLDRCSRIERGDFDFQDVDASDDEGDEVGLNRFDLNGDAMEL